MRTVPILKSHWQLKQSIVFGVTLIIICVCTALFFGYTQSRSKQFVAMSELHIRPAPTRVYEINTADCWIVLTPNGYFEFVTVDTSKPLNAQQKAPMVVRLSGSYREIPTKQMVTTFKSDTQGYTIIFNVDPKSVVSIGALSKAPGWLAKWGSFSRNRMTELLEDYSIAVYSLNNPNVLYTNIRMVQSISTLTKAVFNSKTTPERYTRIGPLRYDRLLLESKPGTRLR
jgi:hypothetical protein